MKLDFGYWPDRIDIVQGDLLISTLSNFDESVSDVETDENIRADWIYPGNQRAQLLGAGQSIQPYCARVFGLPKTHSIEHKSSDNAQQLEFHIWALSYFKGMRFTATEAGFLDSTPIKRGKLVDFLLCGKLEDAVQLAETFWDSNNHNPIQTQRFGAAVHALFMAQNPQHLQFEQFIYLYTALDACFALLWESVSGRKPNHAQRIAWMCNKVSATTPDWATTGSQNATEISALRNNAIHEALFAGEPLGFSLKKTGGNRNLMLEMQALTCRILAGIIGIPDQAYIQSPVNTRQIMGLHIS